MPIGITASQKSEALHECSLLAEMKMGEKERVGWLYPWGG